MCYTNLRSTYLLTYLLRYLPGDGVDQPAVAAAFLTDGHIVSCCENLSLVMFFLCFTAVEHLYQYTLVSASKNCWTN